MNRQQVIDFRQQLKSGPVYGPFSKTEDPALIECLGHSGFDFCIIDLEHGPNSIRSAQNLVRAAEVSGLLPIVRVPEGMPALISAALDIGAAGVQIPQVDSVTVAHESIEVSRYAPAGMRGVCRFIRNACYSATPKEDYFGTANDALVILQLEGQKALDNLEQILDVEGFDIIFIGPYDLSQSLGLTGQTQHPDVVALIEKITMSCVEKGIAVGTFVESIEDAAVWGKMGIHYFCYSVDIGIFYSACRAIVSELCA